MNSLLPPVHFPLHCLFGQCMVALPPLVCVCVCVCISEYTICKDKLKL